MTMATLRLRFVDSNDNLVARVIRGAQMGLPWSHVEAVIPDGLYLGALIDGGVQARLPAYDSSWTRQLFVDVPATDLQLQTWSNFLGSKIGLPYDEAAIAEMAEGTLTGAAPAWDQASAYICSALQTAALLAAGIVKSAPAGVRLATPRDVLIACGALATVGVPETRT